MAEEFIWRPSAEVVEAANVTRLGRALGAADYHALHRISVEEPDRFWPAVVADLGIEFSTPWERVVDRSRGPEWATWFTGGRVNAARVCVHRWAAERPDEEALVGRYEDGRRESLTWAEASRAVTQLAEALVELGVREGDRVAIFMPMCPAVAVASHACAHVGAVQVPIFSGFAAPAIASRLEDSQAKVVLCADWSLRRGKRVEMRETLDGAGGFAVEHVVAWNRETGEWPEVVSRQPGVLAPVEVDSEAPYLLAYTSGTTGRPKGALHVQGGFLVSIAREVAYQTDVKAGDRVHFATDMGWIMGPWTVLGGGAVGATVVFAEGAPDWPDDRLWELVESERVTMLGLSPTLVRALIPKGEPTADLSTLRTMCTTGEPWNPGPYRWLFEHVGGSRAPIVNVSGGTEVGACFLTTVITEPVKPVALGFPALGLDMDVVDAEGRPLRGEVGELVCRNAWPGMTRGVWGDDERYLDTYWRRFPGVWTHGDWASIDADGYWFLHGRSDDTLNIAGKRIGPAELESAAIGSGIVAEAAAIGVPHEVKGEVAWIFCVALPGEDPDDARVAGAVADVLGKAFKPDRILWVAALPKTRSAKIVRRAVRAQALGKDPGDVSSLENPESLEEIARVAG
ncbi:MAG TPA: AMP-binding protein [Gaiellaceae bacterium]|jgi:acetyl-CoA synthetase|nr:AMP-binding protein [Gaiellaceae bacterium]